MTPENEREMRNQAMVNVWHRIPKYRMTLATACVLVLLFAGEILEFAGANSVSDPVVQRLANALPWACSVMGFAMILMGAFALYCAISVEQQKLAERAAIDNAAAK